MFGELRRGTGPVSSAILPDSIPPGGILNETIAGVTDILGRTEKHAGGSAGAGAAEGAGHGGWPDR